MASKTSAYELILDASFRWHDGALSVGALS